MTHLKIGIAMGRPRKTHKNLPLYVRFKHGAYHFTNPLTGKSRMIGKTLTEMYISYAKIAQQSASIRTIDDLFDRYINEISPNKAAATYRNDLKGIINLKDFFSSMSPFDVKPIHVYQYLDARGAEAKIGANREVALLSHIFSMGIKWGVIETNPCIGIKKHKENRRNRYITDEEFSGIIALASPLLKCLIEFAFLTGLRKNDILNIKLASITDQGLEVNISKTKRKAVIYWNDDLREIVDKAKKIKRDVQIGVEYLFATKAGSKMTSSGLMSAWKRLQSKAMKDGVIKETFRFHDIRRKAATEAEKSLGREHARQLLTHTTQTMTERYISGALPITPLKKLSKMKN